MRAKCTLHLPLNEMYTTFTIERYYAAKRKNSYLLNFHSLKNLLSEKRNHRTVCIFFSFQCDTKEFYFM